MTDTYVRGWALVSARAGEGDKFMASLVHHKTADCKRENEGRRGGRGEVESRKGGEERKSSLGLDFVLKGFRIR